MKPTSEIFLKFCSEMGIPKPIAEHRFAPDRRWRFDYAWPEHLVALEVEGGIWIGGRHTSAKGYVKDMAKYNRASVMGWRILRCQPKDLLGLETVMMLKEALA